MSAPFTRRRVAVDTSFLFPLVHQRHEHHEEARRIADEFKDAQFVTTDGVVSEFLSMMSNQSLRPKALALVKDMLSENSQYRVFWQTRRAFQQGIERYASQKTGSPSLVDCMLMDLMDAQNINVVLAFDRDFRHVGLYDVYPQRG